MTYPAIRPALLLSLLFVTAVASTASVTFSRDTYPNAPFDFTHADLNNDGREDLISVCGSGVGSGNGQLAIGLSTGDGVYDPQVCYKLPSGGVIGVAVGDFNSDGNLDLVVLSDSSIFYLYLNDGKGRFHQQGTFPASSQATFLTTADANHDGQIDLLWVGFNDPNLHVWFGNGQGGFTPGPSSPIAIQGTLGIGDFDGDGNVDVISQFNTFSNSIQVLYGDGHGHFAAQPAFGDDVFYEVYDVDGDGKTDLIGTPFDFSTNGSTYYKDVRILRGNANRTFTQQDVALNQCSSGFPPAVADFNGDGIPDIVIQEASDCQGSTPFTLEILLGNGDGTFQPEQSFYSTGFLARLYVLRVNLDSKPDLEMYGEAPGGSKSTKVFFTDTTPGTFPRCAPPNRGTGFNLCSPTRTVTGTTSVKFSISAANQTPGRKMEVWVDGKKLVENLKSFSHYSFLDATLTLTPGIHRVAIFSAGWDNLVQEYQFTGGAGIDIPLSVKSSTCPVNVGLLVCSPLGEATLGSPVRAWAAGKLNGTSVSRMEVWVDGVKKFSTFNSNTLDTKLDLSSGLHQFTYYLVGNDGTKTSDTVTATVK